MNKPEPWSGLKSIVDQTIARRERDAQRFKEQDGDLCQICWAYGSDKRSLIMESFVLECFYDLTEVVEEVIDIHNCELQKHKSGYYLRICKTCRARFMAMFRDWAAEGRDRRGLSKNHDGCLEEISDEDLIPVQVDGARVMMTHEEYQEYAQKRA